MISSDFVRDIPGSKPSPYPEGSEKDRKYNLNRIIPPLTFITKIGIYLTSNNSF